MSEPALDAAHIIATLNRHNVEYVIVGGYAANIYGAVRPTQDIDVTPKTTPENLARLVTALKELGAGIRVDELPEGLPFDASAESLAGVKMLNLRSPHGDIDLTFAPAAFDNGYDDLMPRAHSFPVAGLVVVVADLDDVIASKTQAARAKDFEALPELRRLSAARKLDGA